MHLTQEGKLQRTDIWREGTWLDLWSVVHLLSGISVGFGFYFLHFGTALSVVIAFVSLVTYELWEALVKIEETPTNRCMDVVVGMVGFLPTFFIIAPALSVLDFFIAFGIVFTLNVSLSIIGWHASQKAAALEKRLRERFALKRMRRLERRMRLRSSKNR